MTTWIEWTDEEYGNLGLQSIRIHNWLWIQEIRHSRPDYRERFKYWLHQWPDEKEFHVWAEVELWAYLKMKKEDY